MSYMSDSDWSSTNSMASTSEEERERRLRHVPQPTAQVTKRKNEEALGDFKTPGGLCEDLHSWLSYACQLYSAAPNDFVHHMRRGTHLLAFEIDRFCRRIHKYERGLPVRMTLQRWCKLLGDKHTWMLDAFVQDYDVAREPDVEGCVSGWSASQHALQVFSLLRFLMSLACSLLRQRLHAPQRKLPHTEVPRGALVELAHNRSLRFIVPQELLASYRQFPDLDARGVFLYTHERSCMVGQWSQYQVWMQWSKLALEWHDMSPECPELHRFVQALLTRTCEICAQEWPRVNHLGDIGPSAPLDMGALYELPSRFRGVPPEDRGAQLDLSFLSQMANNRNNQKARESVAEKNRWREDDQMTISRAFLGEMGGIMAPMLRQLLFYEHALSLALLSEQEQQQAQEQLALDAMRSVHATYTFAQTLEGFRAHMCFERAQVRDENYQEQMVVQARREALALGLDMRHAFVPANFFGMPDQEKIENYQLPRPTYLGGREVYRKRPLEAFEQEPMPWRVRIMAVLSLFEKVAFQLDPDLQWLKQVLVQCHDAVEYARFNAPPFMLLLAGRVYVRRADRFFRCTDAYHACLLWLLVTIVDHNCVSEIRTRVYEQKYWLTLFDRVVKACDLMNGTSDQHWVAPYADSDSSSSSSSSDSSSEEEYSDDDDDDPMDVLAAPYIAPARTVDPAVLRMQQETDATWNWFLE